MPKANNLLGLRFCRLEVVSRAENDKHGKTMWVCKCDCGNEIVAAGQNLLRGRTKSCGCLYEERAHRKSGTRLYSIWQSMKCRCYNKNHFEFYNYGGKGISICDEWLNDFQSFYSWAIENGYADDLTIDRIDNNKGYFPHNCRWATYKEQANNKRTNHLITYNGKTQNIAQWAKELGIKRVTLQARITRYDWDLEKALSKE
jgi:hypothetical protein